MDKIWQRIRNWFETNAPELLSSLGNGATEREIAEFEDFLCVQLPEDVKASFQIHNGGVMETNLLSLEEIKEEWQIWKDLLDGGTFQDWKSNPEKGIENVWWSPKWIPLTSDTAGNHECLDLNPAEGGNMGQIITMWHDDAERRIVAISFRAWLTQYAETLESGKLIYHQEYGIVDRNGV